MTDAVPVLHITDFDAFPGVGCDPAAWGCQLALEEKSVPREDRWHDPPASATAPPPRLRHGEQEVEGAVAILTYVDLTWRTPVLLPPRFRGRALTRLHEADTLHAAATDLLASLAAAEPEADARAALAGRLTLLWRQLQLWERHLQADAFVAGPWPSLADLRVYPYVATVQRLGLELETSLPALAAWCARMRSRSAVIRSWPEPWADEDGPRPLLGM